MREPPTAGVFESDDAASPGLFEMIICQNNFLLSHNGQGCKATKDNNGKTEFTGCSMATPSKEDKNARC